MLVPYRLVLLRYQQGVVEYKFPCRFAGFGVMMFTRGFMYMGGVFHLINNIYRYYRLRYFVLIVFCCVCTYACVSHTRIVLICLCQITCTYIICINTYTYNKHIYDYARALAYLINSGNFIGLRNRQVIYDKWVYAFVMYYNVYLLNSQLVLKLLFLSCKICH